MSLFATKPISQIVAEAEQFMLYVGKLLDEFGLEITCT